MRLHYAIIFVTDMNRSVAFYRDVLGIPTRFVSPEWTELATEGATLALHVTKDAGAHSPTGGAEPAGHCRPGLSVDDLAAFHERMVNNKVPCLQQPREQFGSRIAQYADPDGLTIAVSEAPKRR